MAGPGFLFTSECVSEGHPDKICDQVSDAILDACLTKDPESKVACGKKHTHVKTLNIILPPFVRDGGKDRNDYDTGRNNNKCNFGL